MNEISALPEFQEFGKIARLSREVIVTEKIDGTNGCVYIEALEGRENPSALYQSDGLALWAGSRTRWVTPESDNFGFATWVKERAAELLLLGPGRHYGEWWGRGIQRGYELNERRFSLFNTTRWCLHDQTPQRIPCGDPRIEKFQEPLPPCCGLVPVLYRGHFDTLVICGILTNLEVGGSKAAPGFLHPEGIVVYHTAGNVFFKKTILKDDEPKTKTNVR